MEVIPWLLQNNGFRAQTRHADVTRTVFAGGLPGNFTAIELAFALQDTFGPVEMVQFHTDRSQYPTGKEGSAQMNKERFPNYKRVLSFGCNNF